MILACVVGLAAGQILFKITALGLKTTGSPWHASVMEPLVLALILYGTVTAIWVWVLQNVALSRAYPFMALSFVIVPLASWLVFGEQLDLRYLIGTTLIFFGVILCTR